VIAAITGGCGFIGSRLALALADDGIDVRVVDLAPPPPDLRRRCAIAPVDIRDRAALRRVFDRAAVVFHCAALLGRACELDRDDAWDTNVAGTGHVLDEVARAGVPRAVFTSTGGVYAGQDPPVHEGSRVLARTLYAASKLAGEAMVAAAMMRSRATAVVLRLFTVYGPGPASGTRGHFIAGWLEHMLRGEPLIVHGDGSQTVDATHVDDVVRAMQLAMRVPIGAGEHRVYNIGSGCETPVIDVARCLRAVEPGVELRHVPPPASTPARQLADIGRARSELGYAPAIAPRAGIIALARQARTSAARSER
jgi:UDP-glucose 4-epimerase